ncbi:MAG: hypothetical protein AAFZ89_01725 [Bacteroidota bacterium]
MKKQYYTALCILFGLCTGLSQNTFPTSGNVGVGTTSPTTNLEINGNLKYDIDDSGERSIKVEGPVRTNHRGNGSQPATGMVYRVLSNPPNGGPIFQIQSSGYAVRFFAEHNGYTGAKDNSAWFGGGKDNYFKNNVGIGTLDTGAWKLAVNGKIRAKEINVDTGWSDYVFEKDYKLLSLEEVEAHIQEVGHLPNIPSAEEVAANGILLGEMNAKLLEKIEELTLYIIQQQKVQKELQQRIKGLENKERN